MKTTWQELRRRSGLQHDSLGLHVALCVTAALSLCRSGLQLDFLSRILRVAALQEFNSKFNSWAKGLSDLPNGGGRNTIRYFVKA